MCAKSLTHRLCHHTHSVLGFNVIGILLPFSEVTRHLMHVGLCSYCSHDLDGLFS